MRERDREREKLCVRVCGKARAQQCLCVRRQKTRCWKTRATNFTPLSRQLLQHPSSSWLLTLRRGSTQSRQKLASPTRVRKVCITFVSLCMCMHHVYLCISVCTRMYQSALRRCSSAPSHSRLSPLPAVESRAATAAAAAAVAALSVSLMEALGML